MTANLYRQEALDHLKSSDFGVPVRPPDAQGIAAKLAIGVTIALITWICIGSYTRRVAVKGVLEPRNGVVHLRTPRPGKIVKIHVSPGSRVQAGTTLITLAADRQTEQHGDESVARLGQLSDDRRRLGMDVSSVEKSFKEQERALTGELHTARSRAARIASQRTLQFRKIAIKQDLLDRLSPLLAKGYVSSLQYKEKESELLQAKSELESLSAQHDDARQTAASLSSRLKRLSDDLTEKLSLVGDRLSNVEQAILQTEAEHSLLVKAPLDGEVTNIFIAEGSGTSPSETLITLVPDGGDLVARVLVDSRAIGFVKHGTPVAIRHRPFPYEKFGLHQGRVSRIPGSAVEAQMAAPSPDLASTGAVYRVDVDLPRQSLAVYGREEHLKAGMEVTADLLLDRRTHRMDARTPDRHEQAHGQPGIDTMNAVNEFPPNRWDLAKRLGISKRTPIIRQAEQAEQAECGLACIAMILGHHGQHVSLRDLRECSNLSSRGASLNDLIAIAGEHGLNCRPLRLDLGELEQLQTPCVLHWRLDHFIVLLKISRGHALINDPATGRRRLPLKEVSLFFTGIAMEATPADHFVSVAKKPAIPLRSMFRLLNGYASSLWSILGFSLALEVLALLMPQLVQTVVDQILANGDYDLLTLVGISFVLLTLISSAISACRSWSVAWLRAHGGMRWTGVLIDRLLRLQQHYFERRHVGDVVSRVDAVHTIQQAVTNQLVGAVMDGLVGAATLVLLLVYSPMLAAAVACGTLTYALLRWSIYRRLREVSIDQIEAAAAQRTDLIECIRGIRTIRLNNKTAIRSALHANKTASVQAHQFRSDKLGILFEAAGSILGGMQRVIVLCVGASLAMRGQMTAGMLMAFSAYADQFSQRSNALIDYLVQLRLLKVQGERVADVILSPEEPHMHGTYQGPEHAPSIRFDNVSYRYSSNSPWILRNASLSIKPGECVAIVGTSGAGKTTALRLLLGLIDPCEGSVRIGGIDLANLGKSSFRERTGVVLQDDHLFSGTLADNICFFDASANMDDIYAAAALAGIHDDICAMPMGYRTLVGDMGSSLSGGQKQRVVLARAIYRKPSVLVLDEATSHLDLVTESEVTNHLTQLKMTRITVAHRPETVRAADRVFELADGQFSELRPTALD